MTQDEIQEYIKSKPDSNFVVFTHVDGNRPWQTDYLIRRILSRRYDLPIEECFSHTGTVWYDVEKDENFYWHQTFPVFTKDKFNTRPYNVIYEVEDPNVVKFARIKCKNLYEAERGYAVGTLINYAFTIWFDWLSNVVTAGKVCSEAVAASYPTLIEGNKSDIDPNNAAMQLDNHNLKKFIIDETKKR